MSLEAKQAMIRKLDKAMSDVLTAGQIESMIAALTDILGGYEVEAVADPGEDVTTEEFLQAFLAAKQIEGRSPKTLARYEYMIRKMLADVKVPAKDVTIYHIRSYFMREKQRGISDRSIEGARSIASSFFGWLFKEGLIQRDPTGNLGTVKYIKTIKKPFSAVEMELLRENCKTDRDRALVSFLASTGCRISEVCALDRDIDYRSGECTVMGKGAKERRVYIDQVTIMHLDRYLSKRKDQSPALFVGKGTERIAPNGVRVALNRIGKRANVENVHPHRFRRTLATNLISRGMEIQDVAAILGHDNINTTMTYVYIDQTAVKSSYQRYA